MVTFRLDGDFDRFFLCHCKHCQKDSGSAHAANLFSSTGKIDWLTGQEKVQTFNLPGTRHTKSFCSHCGSAMPYTTKAFTVVPAGCLDTELTIKPDAHIFLSSKSDWSQDLDHVPEFESYPS